MKKVLILILLAGLASCSSAQPRSHVSASGNPEDIFFEKEIASMDKHDSAVGRTNSVNSEDTKEDPITLAKNDPLPSTSPRESASGDNYDEVGYSSWYGDKYSGKPTASGEKFDPSKLTAAHPSLPMGTILRVKNLENAKEITVRVNDRGPFAKGRILDVTEKAADILGFKDAGMAKVGLKVMQRGEQPSVKDADLENLENPSLEDESVLLDNSNKKPAPQRLVPLKLGPGVSTAAAGTTPKGYTVQVGVFSEKERAENLKQALQGKFSAPVFIFPRGQMYVVQIGDYPDRTGAETLETDLEYNGYDAFIQHK